MNQAELHPALLARADTQASILVVDEMRSGNFNSASALSTMVFLMIFAVAFIMVKFLGANVVRTQEEQRKGVR